MGSKARILAAVLAGLVIAVVAVKMQKGSMSIAGALVSANDVERNMALKKLQAVRGERKEKVIGELAGQHASAPAAETRVFALYALRKSGDMTEPVISALVKGLSDPDEAVRREADVGLREIGTPVLGALIPRMNSPGVRATAAQIVRVASEDAIAPIADVLRNPDDDRRLAAVFLLSHVEKPETREAAKPFLPDLYGNLSSENPALAVTTAFAVNNLDATDSRPAEVFLAQLAKEDWDAWDVRGWDALNALSRMPSAAARTAPALGALVMNAPDGLQKNRRFKRAALGAALEKIAPRKHDTSTLSADLRSKDPVLRWRATYVLSSSSKVDPAFMGPLVTALDDPDDATAARAFAALNVMGLAKTERVAAKVHPKLRATVKRLDGKIPGFSEMALPAMEGIGN